MNKQYIKGVVFLLLAIVLGLLTYGIAAFVVWIVGIIDAAGIALRLNRGETVAQWQFF